MNGSKEPVIRASEVEEYIFCPRAWWLRRVRGIEPESAERLREGEEFHRAHQNQVFALGRLWLVGLALLLVGLCLILFAFMR